MGLGLVLGLACCSASHEERSWSLHCLPFMFHVHTCEGDMARYGEIWGDMGRYGEI